VPDEPSSTETLEPAGYDDPLRRPLLEALQAELGDAVVGHELARKDLWVRVHRQVWRRTGEFCRDQLGMNYFCFLSGIDWMPNPDLLGEKAWEADEPAAGGQAAAGNGAPAGDPAPAPSDRGATISQPVTGVAGGASRFQVFARLYNVESRVGITLKADLHESDPRVDSWVPLWRGADWHERECWEMYGFEFDGHPRLRHLYLPGEFEGHPLRKDFPLLARIVKPWPGLVDVEPIPGEADTGNAADTEGAEEG
jgi:NADH-quinone oxidoreductase subunit C